MPILTVQLEPPLTPQQISAAIGRAGCNVRIIQEKAGVTRLRFAQGGASVTFVARDFDRARAGVRVDREIRAMLAELCVPVDAIGERLVVVGFACSPLAHPIAHDARVMRLVKSRGDRPLYARLVDGSEGVVMPSGGEEWHFVDGFHAWHEMEAAAASSIAKVRSMNASWFYSFLSRVESAMTRARSRSASAALAEDPGMPSMPKIRARLGNVLFRHLGEMEDASLVSVADLNARIRSKPTDRGVMNADVKVCMAAELGGTLGGLSGLDAIEERFRYHFDSCDVSPVCTEFLALSFCHLPSSKRAVVNVRRSCEQDGSGQHFFSSPFVILDRVFTVDQAVLGRDYDFRVATYRRAFASRAIREDIATFIEDVERVGVDWDEARLIESLDESIFRLQIVRRRKRRALTVKRGNLTFKVFIESIMQVDHQESCDGRPKVTFKLELDILCVELENMSGIEAPTDVAGSVSEQEHSVSPLESSEWDTDRAMELVAHLYQFAHDITAHVLPTRL